MKPRILALSRFYLPGYRAGGPIRSVANLVERLSKDFEWMVLTSDRDLGAENVYPGIAINAWNVIGKARVFYVPKSASIFRIMKVIRDTPHDLLYLNSYFDPRFSVLPAFANRFRLLTGAPMLVAPRGEFSEGAFRIKSWKKRPFVGLGHTLGVHQHVLWHASTELERDDIMSVVHVPASRIHVARNLAALSTAGLSNPGGREGPLRVCFFSRIARKKNLDYALRILARVQRPISFSIYGPREDPAYWSECQALIQVLPENIRVEYGDAVPAEEVPAMLAQHDILFLPTRGENFGHVFLEAWAVGLPVLTSDQTPWRELGSHGVGWDIPLDNQNAFVQALEEVAGWDQRLLAAYRERCINFAARHSRDDQALEDHQRMFFRILEHV